MATNLSNPGLLTNTRNASSIDIDATFQKLPRYKAITWLDGIFYECMSKVANFHDIADLLDLLKAVKNSHKIHPTVIAIKKPLHVDGTKFSFKMAITFLQQAKEIKASIHIIYPNREHILTSANHPTTEAEIAYSKLLKELENTYKKF